MSVEPPILLIHSFLYALDGGIMSSDIAMTSPWYHNLIYEKLLIWQWYHGVRIVWYDSMRKFWYHSDIMGISCLDWLTSPRLWYDYFTTAWRLYFMKIYETLFVLSFVVENEDNKVPAIDDFSVHNLSHNLSCLSHQCY